MSGIIIGVVIVIVAAVLTGLYYKCKKVRKHK